VRGAKHAHVQRSATRFNSGTRAQLPAHRSIRFDFPTPLSNTLTTAGNLAYQLAHALSGDCKLAEAEAIERELLDVQKRVLGAGHPSTLTTAGNLAYSLSGLESRTKSGPVLGVVVVGAFLAS